MNALVLGGSVFVGRRLVEMLVAGGHQVTVLNRGRTPSELPGGVQHLVADRTDRQSMRAALDARTWDAIFDVSGFVMAAGGSDVDDLLDLVDGSVGHYVYVSSIMAYDQHRVGVSHCRRRARPGRGCVRCPSFRCRGRDPWHRAGGCGRRVRCCSG